MRDGILAARAKQMRRAQTPAERIVWQTLRQPPFDVLHFRRQVAFDDRYIADFASHRAKLVVEVDGRSHDLTAEADAVRTRWFAVQGYRVVRIANDVVHNRQRDLDVVLGALLGK